MPPKCPLGHNRVRGANSAPLHARTYPFVENMATRSLFQIVHLTMVTECSCNVSLPNKLATLSFLLIPTVKSLRGILKKNTEEKFCCSSTSCKINQGRLLSNLLSLSGFSSQRRLKVHSPKSSLFQIRAQK